MKSEKNAVEGQLDIFEAMNRAAAAVDRMVEEETAAKRTGKTKDKNKEQNKVQNEEQKPEISAGRKTLYGCDMHASMQRTFVNRGNDDFATVAYIDYNMIYWKDWNAPSSLRIFASSKDAVDFYVRQLEKLQKCEYAEMTGEHEPFCDVRYLTENVYVECGD